MSAFRPERWLVEEAGKVSFNKMAGLHLTFGLGPRGCFGRRLAYVKLRLFVCLLVWNFVFEPIDGELASRAFVDKLTRVPTKCFVKLSPAN
jgi:cytochrome P450